MAPSCFPFNTLMVLYGGMALQRSSTFEYFHHWVSCMNGLRDFLLAQSLFTFLTSLPARLDAATSLLMRPLTSNVTSSATAFTDQHFSVSSPVLAPNKAEGDIKECF